jgi:hypothetical protein
MTGSSTILQIVPRAPGIHDAVGDYAFTVANKLRDLYSRETVFATAVGKADSFPYKSIDFEIVPLTTLVPRHSQSQSGSDRSRPSTAEEFQHVILHYVNYGYQKRGVPFGLLSILRELRRRCPGRILTIFHEFYASGPPWKSAFWLRPLQMRIAKSISQMSDAGIVSSHTMLMQLQQLTPSADIRVHPVFSIFGEPSLSADQLANRSPHRWAICGGTGLVERSLRSFRGIINQIPERFSPRELFVIGGSDNPATRALLADLPNIRTDYYPQIGAAEASEILSACAFAWLDYFHRADVSTDVVLKSSVFAATCAHGIIPVFPHQGSAISIKSDRLNGPFFVGQTISKLPALDERTKVAAEIYDWYRRNAASDHLVREIVHLLKFDVTLADR